ILRYRAAHQPDRPAYTFLLDGEATQADLTYGELDRQARAIGALLQDAGAAGERVLLLAPPGLDYIAAFFGCLYAGVVAVPAYPPRRHKPSPRIEAMIADCAPSVVVTTKAILGDLTAPGGAGAIVDPAALRWLAVDALDDSGADGWRPPAIDAASLAFLQYTSGSTGDPKGVMVAHGNLIANSAAIHERFGVRPG